MNIDDKHAHQLAEWREAQYRRYQERLAEEEREKEEEIEEEEENEGR